MKALISLIILHFYSFYRLFYKYIESIILRTNAQKNSHDRNYKKNAKNLYNL